MDFIRTVCFGLSPIEFLRQELQLTPAQNRVAWRIFTLLLLLALIAVSTRLPGLRTVAFFLALLIPQLVMTTRMAFDSLLLFLRLVMAAVFLSLLTVMLWQDQGYFLLPFSIGLIVLMMFHARVHRFPNILPIFYGTLTLFNPSDPVTSVDNALWSVLIVGGGTVLSCVLLATVLWPTEAQTLLRMRMTQRLEEFSALLDKVLQIKGNYLSGVPANLLLHLPGWTSDTLKQLDDTLRDHPELESRRAFWQDAIMELDALHNGLIGYYNLLVSGEAVPDSDGADMRVLEALGVRVQHLSMAIESDGRETVIHSTAQGQISVSEQTPPILQRMVLTSQRLGEAVDRIYNAEPAPRKPYPVPQEPMLAWLHLAFLESHQGILLWSLKVGLACLVVTLVVVSMNAGQVDTAIITTVIVADSTLGADFRKSLMRISGALTGAVMGYIWLILAQPMADTVAGLLVTLIPPFYLCARFAATSPRLNYAGLQMGLAFCMVVFSEQSPGTYLGTGWYRVLGILLGISVMGVVDYLFWPARSIDVARRRLHQMIMEIQDQLPKGTDLFILDLDRSLRVLRVLDVNIRDAYFFLDFAKMEPGAMEEKRQAEIQHMGDLIQTFMQISKIIESRHRLFLKGDAGLNQWVYSGLLTPLVPAYRALYASLVLGLEGQEIHCDSFLERKNLCQRIEEFQQAIHEMEFKRTDRQYFEAVIDLEALYQERLLDILAGLSKMQGMVEVSRKAAALPG